MSPHDVIKAYINRAYGHPDGYRPPFYVGPYSYCGRLVDQMGVEEASNIVQTKLSYGGG